MGRTIDDCFRRRAGVTVGVPEDRLISEDERDRLSKELGDGFRVQAKMSKEIEEMDQGAIGIEI